MKRTITIIFLALLLSNVGHTCEKADCGAPTAWYEGNNIELIVSDGQSQDRSRWHMVLYSGNDIIIEKDERYQGQSIHGTLGVIGGKIMITKGLTLKTGYEIDAADGPALMIQLLMQLLSEAVPEGPSSIATPVIIEHKEEEKGIKVATAAASGVFGAPWQVTGTLSPDKNAVINFDLKFRNKTGENDYNLVLTGVWAKDAVLGDLRDDMDISEWKTYKIGPYSRKYKGGTIYDFGAQPISETFKTLAELRTYIAESQKSKKQVNEDASH